MQKFREQNRAILAEETGTIHKTADFRMALCYPSPYSVAMSSLGYQVIYRIVNEHKDFVCERAMLPERPQLWRRSRTPLFTMESETAVSNSDIIAFSVAFELELHGIFDVLELAGLSPFSNQRPEKTPPVLMGGPITLSNPLPLGPFADIVILGDAEVAIQQFLQTYLDAPSKTELLNRCAVLPGFWVPALHGERTSDTLKVTKDHVPAYAQIVTPRAELANMYLIEASRGCPRMCSFCVVRAEVSPMRGSEPKRVLDLIPDWAPRVGFVGAAVSDYEHIREIIAGVVAMGKGVGVSSLRADRLDEDLVGLLKQGGYRTLTVAADAPSERMRSKIMKGIRERHLVRAAELARWAGFHTLKMYMIIGLPGETQDDIDELLRLCRYLSKIAPLALTLSPFVPKLHTPLCDAPFAGIKMVENQIGSIRQALSGQVDVRAASARWAWVEYRLSQGGIDTGSAAYEAYRNGGSFGAWKQALDRCGHERSALDAAQRYALWSPDGLSRDSRPRPPKPPKRLPWTGFGIHNPAVDMVDNA
ncbi:MAG: radical SAM protein [Myxococcales bacterium]|nr:radical SAM protein [Myxococcales bacterium]